MLVHKSSGYQAITVRQLDAVWGPREMSTRVHLNRTVLVYQNNRRSFQKNIDRAPPGNREVSARKAR
jgi:hypothetical protein